VLGYVPGFVDICLLDSHFSSFGGNIMRRLVIPISATSLVVLAFSGLTAEDPPDLRTLNLKSLIVFTADVNVPNDSGRAVSFQDGRVFYHDKAKQADFTPDGKIKMDEKNPWCSLFPQTQVTQNARGNFITIQKGSAFSIDLIGKGDDTKNPDFPHTKVSLFFLEGKLDGRVIFPVREIKVPREGVEVFAKLPNFSLFCVYPQPVNTPNVQYMTVDMFKKCCGPYISIAQPQN
jgi:hypothetical protein